MTLARHPAAGPATDPGGPAFLLLIDLDRGRITVRGELDRAHVGPFGDAVDVLHHSPSRLWSVDASGITFCDAAGLRALLRAHAVAVRRGASLVVERPGRTLSRLIALVQSDGLGALRVEPEVAVAAPGSW
jgi:anti-anti-sigma regulatory factor